MGVLSVLALGGLGSLGIALSTALLKGLLYQKCADNDDESASTNRTTLLMPSLAEVGHTLDITIDLTIRDAQQNIIAHRQVVLNRTSGADQPVNEKLDGGASESKVTKVANPILENGEGTSKAYVPSQTPWVSVMKAKPPASDDFGLNATPVIEVTATEEVPKLPIVADEPTNNRKTAPVAFVKEITSLYSRADFTPIQRPRESQPSNSSACSSQHTRKEKENARSVRRNVSLPLGARLRAKNENVRSIFSSSRSTAAESRYTTDDRREQDDEQDDERPRLSRRLSQHIRTGPLRFISSRHDNRTATE